LNVTFAAWDVAWQIKNNPSDELESTYPDAYDAIVNNDASLAFTISSIAHIILKNRTVSEGCGRGYYSCNQSSADLHSVRSCNEQRTWVDENSNVIKTGTCNDQFRNCIGHSIDHDPTNNSSGETPHTDDPPGLYPVGASTITIDGEEMVDTAPGDTVSVNVVTKAGGVTQIYWYLADSDDTGLGDQVGNPSYPPVDDVEADVSYSFSIPSDASGVYTFTAYIYPHSSAPDQTVYTYSFKIYVS
jgi:hypothetical protein